MQRTSAVRPSPIACDECRRKHLKCDAAAPVCQRCSTYKLSCTYTASRRGHARRSRPRGTFASTQESLGTTYAFQPPTPQDTASTGHSNQSQIDQVNENSAGRIFPGLSSSTTVPSWTLNDADRNYLINLFYIRFYSAHPILVPRVFYDAYKYPAYLDLVVCFVGHHFGKPMAATTALRDAVYAAMADVDEHTVPRIQALIMYAVVLHSRHQPKEAELCIARAAKIALALGLNHSSYAKDNSDGQQVVEESLRRTWWELYTVDVYIAALHYRSASETNGVRDLPYLPCSQAFYEAGKCDATPPTLRAFENRVFALDPRLDFSTYCYRIEAIRIVGRVLAVSNSNDADSDSVQAVDNALASWKYTLPCLQPDVIDAFGDVDEMLFQAHCFVYCASILLHFPRSDLPATVPSVADITCAKGYQKLNPTSTQHTIKAIAASKGLSDLAAVPWPLEKHSPLFTCGLVLGCVVQLAAASIHHHQCGVSCSQQHRDRVVLMFSALKNLGEKWAVAQNAVHFLKVVAETVFSPHDQDDHNAAPQEYVGMGFDDSGSFEDFAGMPWMDLLAMEGLQGDILPG